MKTLHILNGDATLHGFNDTGLDGDVVVWREMLSEGPLEEDISSAHFWRTREEWIEGAVGEDNAGYQHKVLDELSKLNEPYDVINIWFEFDLFCQANMLGVIAYLNQKTDLSAPAVYLICPGDYPGKADFRGMGELNGEELEYLYDNIREQLSDEDFTIAAGAWKAYAAHDAGILFDFLTTTVFWGSFHFLKPALEAQLKRLQINAGGHNYIEQKLLDIYNSGIKMHKEIYAEFWKTEKIYGMGDAQIELYLKKLGI